MRTSFSKPLEDIAQESDDWLRTDQEWKLRQETFLRTHPTWQQRLSCVLCAKSLTGEAFTHRGVEYVLCEYCGHIQDKYMLPKTVSAQFSTVYPVLSPADHASRVQRVYTPKLEWIVRELQLYGLTAPLAEEWFEIGSGGGYFLDALRRAGVTSFRGVEADFTLAERAGKLVGTSRVLCSNDAQGAVNASTARIFTSFFVLEHLDNPTPLLNALARKPAGTIFVFAVPVFGLSTLLEGVFPEFAARSLNGMIHRQIFTDRSISFLLKEIGYTPTAQWIFGQDAADLSRVLQHKAKELFPKTLAEQCRKTLTSMQNAIQQSVDRNFFCDARHILAVKD